MKAPDLKLRLTIAVCCVGMIFTDITSSSWGWLRSSISHAVTPVVEAAHTPVHLANKFIAWSETQDELLQQQHALKAELVLMKAKAADSDALRFENDNLRLLLGAAKRTEFEVGAHPVVEFQFGHKKPYLTLGAGQGSGIDHGMPVMDSEGIIGFVTEANAKRSNVMLVTNPSFALPVAVLRNGVKTLVEGRGPGSPLEVMHLPQNTDISEGDVLVTSGLGSRYPRGVPVARVSKIVREPGAPFLRVEATPVAALDLLDYVLVIYEIS